MKTSAICIKILKWFPIISTLAIIISFIFALFDITIMIKILSYPFSTPIFTCILLIPLSKLFRFCKWHRILIYNLLLVAIFSYVNSLCRIASSLTTLWIILLITSIASLLSFICYRKKHE